MTGVGRRTGTLRFRVTALAALAVLGVLTAVGIGLALSQRATLTAGLDDSLVDRSAAVADRVRAGQPVERRDLEADDVVVQVLATDGTVLASSPGLADVRLGPAAAPATTIVDGALPDGAPARVAVRPVAGATIYVAGGLDDVRDSTRALGNALLVAVPVTTVVLAGLVWGMVGRVLRPVERIRAEVEGISASRLDRRVPQPATADEVARLAQTMNAMLDRLAGAVERQRRFVADAAHELRSPVARIRTQLEVDRAHPDLADQRGTQESVLAEVVALQRLVDDLLLLARGDAGAADPRRAGPIDLDDVVRRLAAERRLPGGPELDTRGVVPVQLWGDAAGLDRAVANLLDNAVRHARGRVSVTLESAAAAVVLTVSDDGPGIPEASREAVFERFVRLDAARSSHSGGAGLGLAIARDIAERHGGTLTVDAAGVAGARFVLVLRGDAESQPPGVRAASPG